MEMSFNLWFPPFALKRWTILAKIWVVFVARRALLVVEDEAETIRQQAL